MISDVVSEILAVQLSHPVRVAIDGRSGSGKTTFAEELAAELRRSGREVIRASVDGFHHPAAVRHRQGRLSANGYYEDARDHDAIRTLLLDPLGPGGSLRYAVQSFDLETDVPIAPVFQQASDNAILIMDGTFVQRPELRPAWDFVIFLDVAAEEARRRGIERDLTLLGGRENATRLYAQRYDPAFARYERECAPQEHANLMIRSLPSRA